MLAPALLLALAAAAAGVRTRLFGWDLDLEQNQEISSPHNFECRFYKGRVAGQESLALLTDCGGQWYGLVQVGREVFVLPRTDADPSLGLPRRRSGERFLFNLTDDLAPADSDADNEVDSGGWDYLASHEDSDEGSWEKVRHFHHPFKEYVNKVRPKRESPGLWLELAVVADHTTVEFHGHKVKHYVLALMNIVSGIFNSRARGLEARLTLVVSRLFPLERRERSVRYGSIAETLRSANDWNKKHLLKTPDEVRWDALVWLTRAPLGGAAGLTKLNGVCTLNSASVTRDEGFTSAFVIAHEIGHLLGLKHDDSGCAGAAGGAGGAGGSIMSRIVSGSAESRWSKCSRAQFHSKARKWACLQQRSPARGYVVEGNSSYIFSMDEQCVAGFGRGFSVCDMSEMGSPPCAVLYCAHESSPLACYSKDAAPLDGTPCRRRHRCYGGQCVPVRDEHESSRNLAMPSPPAPSPPATSPPAPSPPAPSPPAPSPTAPSPPAPSPPAPVTPAPAAPAAGGCSASCGYGVELVKRTCSDGGDCGAQARSCWAGAPCGRDPRGDLCARRGQGLIPYVHANESSSCELWCVAGAGGAAGPHGAVPDGIACSNRRPFDVCYQGVCVTGECHADDVTCGGCARADCRNYTRAGVKRLRSGGWTVVVEVRSTYLHYSLHVATPAPLRTAVRYRGQREVYSLADHSTPYPLDWREENNYFLYETAVTGSGSSGSGSGPRGAEGRLAAAGGLVRWRQTDTDLYMVVEAAPMEDFIVAMSPGADLPLDEEIKYWYNYSVPYTITRHSEVYRGGRGECSAACGGGRRAVRLRCVRGRRCRPLVYEACNTHKCQWQWAAGEWEECSASCGDGGVQTRQLFCVPDGLRLSSNEELSRHSVSPARCERPPPPVARRCPAVPCPVYWQEGPWTECSTTCGPGVRVRPLRCPAADAALCGARPAERRQRCRARRCRRRRPPPRDASDACHTFSDAALRDYCTIADFRKYCAKTCRAKLRKYG